MTDADAVLRTLRPIVEALGASVVPPRSSRAGDLPVTWGGDDIAFVRVGELHGALDRLVGGIERELGARLIDMDRHQKQIAVRRLDEQGVFLLRGAVEEIAQQMGVSRVTLYSYLNALDTAHPGADA